MIIYIDDDILNEDIKSPSNDLVVSLEHIADAFRRGHHIVLGSRDALEAIKEISEISATAKGIYRRILERLPTLVPYMSKMRRYLVLSAAAGKPAEHENGEHLEIRISPSHFAKRMLTSQTILLCENIDDTEYYRKMAEWYAHSEGLGVLPISTEDFGGGGSTTADQYKKIQENENRLCLCIVDGDLKFPGSPIGDTAKAIQAVDDADFPLICYDHIRVKSIENLIPRQLIEMVANDHPQFLNYVNFYKNVENTPVYEVTGFCDLKKGIKGKRLFPPENINAVKYWNDFLTDSGGTYSNLDKDCLTTKICKNTGRCYCRITPAAGERLLNHVNDLLRSLTCAAIDTLIDNRVRSEWARVGRLLTDWACSLGMVASV